MAMNINNVANHPLQSLGWGEFRKKTGVKVVGQNGLQITIHKIPYTPWAIGYLPKGPMPTKEMLYELEIIGKKEKCIFIQIEPDVSAFTSEVAEGMHQTVRPEGLLRGGSSKGLQPSFHPLFTKYTFILDLTKSEEELLKNMHSKTRYNIKVAQKHGVKVVKDNSDEAFETYLKLTRETTKRQGFYAHTENYHRLQWQTLPHKIINQLSSHLLLANYPKPYPLNPTPLVAWIVFVYKDTLYYPYGASSNQYRETMASNLMMWEAIRFGKKLGLKKFDMWGSLGPNPDKKDPWYGFHRF